MLSKDLQLLNVLLLIYITPFGIVTSFKEVQLLNANPPMLLTLFGTFTLSNDIQSSKALS